MPRTTITMLSSKVEVKDIVEVQQTEILQDIDGDWVREWRFYGTPEDDETTAMVLVHTVRCKSPIKANLEITTPPLQV